MTVYDLSERWEAADLAIRAAEEARKDAVVAFLVSNHLAFPSVICWCDGCDVCLGKNRHALYFLAVPAYQRPSGQQVFWRDGVFYVNLRLKPLPEGGVETVYTASEQDVEEFLRDPDFKIALIAAVAAHEAKRAEVTRGV